MGGIAGHMLCLHQIARTPMRLGYPIALLLVALLLPACALDQVPLVGQATTAIPSPTPPPIRWPAPTREPTTVPQVTSAPLPTVAPVPTLAPAITNALEEQQRLLVELYRRVNPAVVSIEVAGRHPPVEGGPTPDQELPFAQGSGVLYVEQGRIVQKKQ